MERLEEAEREANRPAPGAWGCVVAPLAGVGTGVLGSVLLSAAWRACDAGVNGAANGLALALYGALLTLVAVTWWGVVAGYVGRRSPTVALLGGVTGTAVMVWGFVALFQVPHGYTC
ncbi:hypothetical protein ACFV7Q_26915 [Streptomyces sp. NPDC059851]|uniref:hypothetical protein n=1 Tax=Streptomyces sp. NPDC059851 TaxID=3346971 RepID=UPI00364ADB37